MATGRPPTHEHLLTLANKVRAAAEDGDRSRLRSTARVFYDGLVEHLDEEAWVLQRTPPAEGRLLRRGQRRIIDTALALVHDSELAGTQCSCQSRAELLTAELTLQAEDERRCLPTSGGEPLYRRCQNLGGPVGQGAQSSRHLYGLFADERGVRVG